MCCYQTIIHQRIDRTQSKFQQLFLQIPLTNYQNIILLFNVMVSLSAVTLFFITFIESEEFKYSQLVRLFPIIPTILFFLALRSGEKFLYRLTMISWGTFTVLFIISFCTTLIYMINQQQKNFSDSIEALPLFLIFVLRGVIGFLSTLSVLCKIEKKEREFENNFDSKNFISLDYLKVNHRLEKPLLVKIYPKLPTSEVAERMSLLHG
uniref:Uncharacterized protein n=1 Tax=Panagrolaimus sp. ES5 TaxID=591445 RepID=A0AC34FK92_9BILA